MADGKENQLCYLFMKFGRFLLHYHRLFYLEQ